MNEEMNNKIIMLQNKIPENLCNTNIVKSVKTYSKQKMFSSQPDLKQLPGKPDKISVKKSKAIKKKVNKTPCCDLSTKDMSVLSTSELNFQVSNGLNQPTENNSLSVTNGISNIGKDWNEMEFLGGESPRHKTECFSNDSFNPGYARTRKNLVQKMHVSVPEKNDFVSDNIHSFEKGNSFLNNNTDQIIDSCSSKPVKKSLNDTKAKTVAPPRFSGKLNSTKQEEHFLKAMLEKFGSNITLNMLDSPKAGNATLSKSSSPFKNTLNKQKKDSGISEECLISASANNSNLFEEACSSFESECIVQSEDVKSHQLLKEFKETTPKKAYDIKNSIPCVSKRTENVSKQDSLKKPSNKKVRFTNNSLKKDEPKKKILCKRQQNIESSSKVRRGIKKMNCNESLNSHNEKKSVSTIDTTKHKKCKPSNTNSESIKEENLENNSLKTNDIYDVNSAQVIDKYCYPLLESELVKVTPDLLSSVLEELSENGINRSDYVQPIKSHSADDKNYTSKDTDKMNQSSFLLTNSVSSPGVNPFYTSDLNNGLIYMNSLPTLQSANTPTFQQTLPNSAATFQPFMSNTALSPQSALSNSVPSFQPTSTPIFPSVSNSIPAYPPVVANPVSTYPSFIIPGATNIIIMPVPNENSQHPFNVPDANRITQIICNNNADLSNVMNQIMNVKQCNSCSQLSSKDVQPSTTNVFHKKKQRITTSTQVRPSGGDISIAATNAELKIEPDNKCSFFFENFHELRLKMNRKSVSLKEYKKKANEIYNHQVRFAHHRSLNYFYKNVDVFQFLSAFHKPNLCYNNVKFKYCQSKNYSNHSPLRDVIKGFVSFHLKAILQKFPAHSFPLKLNLLLNRNNSKLISPERILFKRVFPHQKYLGMDDLIASLFFIGVVTIFIEFKQNHAKC